MLAAAAVGFGLLAWAIELGGGETNSTDTTPRTGMRSIDVTIDLLLRQDIDGLMATVQMTTLGCSSEQIIGSPPPCLPGEPDGTPVEAFPIGYCEGTWVTNVDQIRGAFGAAISRQPTVAVYAVLRGDGQDASNGFTVAVTEDVPSQPTAPVSFWHLDRDGRIDGLSNECGWYGAAQQIAGRFPTAQYLFGPVIDCQPGPGEYANLIITVDGSSPGSIEPQFVGPAASTLGTPTGERAVVSVLPETAWVGAITRLEDVRSGMELQAVGRRDDTCVIQAETIISAESVVLSNTQMGFETSYPYGWIENAAPFPYASCTGCVTLGPRGVPYPFGIQIYTQPPDPGCDPACYFGIRGVAAEAAHDITVDGWSASRQEIQRQAPLGVVDETGDDTPYRQIATVVERDADALLIVGFFREGDHPAEEQTRAGYDLFLNSLQVFEPAP
jgi:hypothetical protein